MFRENTQEMFCYLEHRTTDFKFNIIKDAYVTLGNSHDSVPYLSRHVRQIEQLGFKVEASALDSGYLTSAVCKGLSDRNIFGVIAIEDLNQPKVCFLNGNLHMIKRMI